MATDESQQKYDDVATGFQVSGEHSGGSEFAATAALLIDTHKLISQARTAHRLGSAVEYVCDTLERMIAWKEADRQIEVQVPVSEGHYEFATNLAAEIALAIQDKYDLHFSILMVPSE